MSVYNGGIYLADTLDSILRQETVDLEVVVVNDGSSDNSLQILRNYADQDSRLRVLDQENLGLTKSLKHGCLVAKGEFIARQDSGDISMPDRLFRQVRRLSNDPQAVAISCHTKFIGPLGEYLYTSAVDEYDLNSALYSCNPAELAGPSHHGSVMMRRSVFLKVGGYREQFYYAQDLDLWSRLVEHGRIMVIPEVLYEARLHPDSISGLQAQEQTKLKNLIAKSANIRRSGKDEDVMLRKAALVQRTSREKVPRRLARGNYFIGSCLRQASPGAAKKYFKAAMLKDLTHWLAWVRYLECSARGWISGN